MRFPAIAIAVGSILFMLAVTVLLMPLIIFSEETMSNPELIRLYYTINGSNVTVTVAYNGTITLKNLVVTFGNQSIEFGHLTKGSVVTRTVLLNSTNIDVIDVSFSIMGLYPVEVEMYVKR